MSGWRRGARLSRDQKALFGADGFVIVSVHDAALRVIEETPDVPAELRPHRAFAEALPIHRNRMLRVRAAEWLKLGSGLLRRSHGAAGLPIDRGQLRPGFDR